MQWKPIIGFEGVYSISDTGEVRRDKPYRSTAVGKILSPPIVKGYRQVALSLNNRRFQRKVHQLVAEAFLGPCPDGMQINHIDCDKLNNRADNLEYVTHSENIRHAYQNGRIKGFQKGNTFGRLSKGHKPGMLTDEGRQKIIDTHTGNQYNKGRKLNPQHIQKLREGHARYYRSRKQ